MKIRKLCLLALLLAPVVAFSASPKADKCPSIAALQRVPVDQAKEDYHRGWQVFTTQLHNYDTNTGWQFLMMVGKKYAESPRDAVNRANLRMASFTSGGEAPIVADDKGNCVCIYYSSDNTFPGMVSTVISTDQLSMER